jgi:hypothetical protein
MHARMIRLGLLVSCSMVFACGGGNAPEAPSTDPVATPAPAPSAMETPDASAPEPAAAKVLTPDPTNAKAASIKGASEKMKFVSGDTPFGNAKGGDNSFIGLIFRTQPAPTTLPDFTKMRPIGALFASSLEVAPGTAFVGFPGIDKARSTEFALRYEGPLNVGKDGDFEIRLVSDDGAKLFIDELLIVDNDGAAGADPKSGKATVHLVKAKHTVRVDYFQAAGNVALQVFATAPGGKEAPLKTNLF